MWSNKSGGGPEQATNNLTEIVPHLFKHNKDAPGFYDTPEKELLQMAHDHYNSREGVLSAFSSWSASLHLVLCYASWTGPEEKPHIAVMDTENIEPGVLIWHCPDLDKTFGVREYLAYGKIRGERGYRAVSLEVLKTRGVLDLFPELEDTECFGDKFGHTLRLDMFEKEAASPSDEDFEIAEELAKKFGPLFFPVYLAMLCLVPRAWYINDAGVCGDREIIEKVADILDQFGGRPTPPFWGSKWLEIGTVKALGFPDVRQWIGLLSAIVEAMN